MSEVDLSPMGVAIETMRLRLRAHHDGDRDDLIRLAGDWHVASWLTRLPHPYTDSDARDWIAHVQRQHATGRPRTFAIALKETDRLIGGGGLDAEGADDTGEAALGYWLGRPYWGSGYAREAVAAFIDYGFRVLGLAAVRAFTHPDNIASQKVLLACGLTRIGEIDFGKPMRRGGPSVSNAPLFRLACPEGA